MKRIRSLSPLLLALPLSLGLLACDLEKEDGADTGANVDDMDDDEMGDEDDPGDDEDPSGSSADTGVDPGDDDDDEGGSTDTGVDPEDTGDTDDGETGEDPGEANGIAMLHGEIPDIDPGESGESGGSGTSGDGGIPEDAVLVVLSNDGAATCEEPWAGSECGGNWTISFTLMPDMLQPGSYNLFEEANGGFSFGDEPHPEGDCAWGGGSLDGTLVIESVDDDAVVGHIEDADAFDFDANVSFVAPRC